MIVNELAQQASKTYAAHKHMQYDDNAKAAAPINNHSKPE
jgi:hypothetical protein